MHGGLQAISVWTQVPVASRTITLPAGSYAIHVTSNQRGNINVAGASTVTAAVSSVTITRSHMGYGGNDSTDNDVSKGSIRLSLTNATTVSADCAVATATASRVSYEVEETY